MRKPKHFSFVWAFLWFLLFGVGLIVYLFWHWSKREDVVYLRMLDGHLDIASKGSPLDFVLKPVRSWWTWSGQRETTWGKAAAYGGPLGVVIILIVIISIASASGGGDAEQRSVALGAGDQAADEAGVLVEITSTPRPTNTAVPTRLPTSTPEPIVIEGFGQFATDSFLLPSGIFRARFTHDGRSNFIVYAYQGSDRNLLINEIGAYRGSRPIFGPGETVLDIDADGAWTFTLEPIGTSDTPTFLGTGDAVSGAFSPTADGAWEIGHTGSSNFVVWLHCAGGSDLVQNEIGVVVASRVVQFDNGPCFWEVEADGQWTLAPR